MRHKTTYVVYYKSKWQPTPKYMGIKHGLYSEVWPNDVFQKDSFEHENMIFFLQDCNLKRSLIFYIAFSANYFKNFQHKAFYVLGH